MGGGWSLKISDISLIIITETSSDCSFFFSRFIAATNDLINFYYGMFFIDEQEVGWPTPNGITLEQATEYCRNYVLQSASGSLCKGVNNVQLDTSLENCVEDIQVGPGTS